MISFVHVPSTFLFLALPCILIFSRARLLPCSPSLPLSAIPHLLYRPIRRLQASRGNVSCIIILTWCRLSHMATLSLCFPSFLILLLFRAWLHFAKHLFLVFFGFIRLHFSSKPEHHVGRTSFPSSNSPDCQALCRPSSLPIVQYRDLNNRRTN